MNRQLAVTIVVLGIVNVLAVAAAPLVAGYAFSEGQSGLGGALYPVLTIGAVVAASLLILHERLAGRRPGFWAWFMLAVTFAFTVWAVVAGVAR